MKLLIKNLRGIESADIDIEPIALVCGLNGAGKTSTALAAAAVLMETASPLPGMAKKDARLLLRDGQARGSASVGEVTVNWPGGSVAGTGKPYSAIVAGLESIATFPEKLRLRLLTDLIGAEPSSEDAVAALTALGISDKTVASVIESIESEGYDAAHKRAQDAGARAKGAWEQITGESYGSKKAETWTPITGEDIPTADELAADAAALQAQIDKAVGRSAISEEERKRLTDLASSDNTKRLNEDHKKALQEGDEARTKLECLRDTIKESSAALHAMPQPGVEEASTPCYSCGAPLVALSREDIRAPRQAPSAAENKVLYARIKEANAKHKTLLDGLQVLEERANEASRTISLIRDQMGKAAEAKKQLEAPAPDGTVEDVGELRARLETVQALLVDIQRYNDAHRKQAQIKQTLQIAALLAPEGLRAASLGSAILGINTTLGQHCAAAKWPMVAINVDGEVTINGKPYVLCSTGEQFRARVVLQFWSAARESAPFIVIDAADVLDKPGRNGLFRAVKAAGIRALITMTYNSPEELPPSQPWLNVYWVESAKTAIKKPAV